MNRLEMYKTESVHRYDCVALGQDVAGGKPGVMHDYRSLPAVLYLRSNCDRIRSIHVVGANRTA